MKDKVNRLEAIKSIVSANRVSGQEELLQRLREQGFDLTQATLSRDLKQLQIVKVSLPAGGYQYILPELAGFASSENFTGWILCCFQRVSFYFFFRKYGSYKNPSRLCGKYRIGYRCPYTARVVGDYCRRRYRFAHLA